MDITLSDGIVTVDPTACRRAVVTLEEWGYDPFTAFSIRAIVKDGVDLTPDTDGRVAITPADTSLSKVRDHLAALTRTDRDEMADRMLPEHWGDYLTAVLDLGAEFWGGADADPKDDSTSGA